MLSIGRAARCGLSAHNLHLWPISGSKVPVRRSKHDSHVRQSRDRSGEDLLSFILPGSPNAGQLVTRRSARHDQIREKKSGGKAKRLIHDPWEHMIRQPSRQCAMSRQLLPKSFLVGLAPVIVPGGGDHPSSLVVQPNRVLHPRFASKYKAQGIWLLCNREIIEAAVDASKRATPFVKALVAAYGSQPMVQRPAHLPAQIQYQLSLRLVQELEVLAEHLSLHTTSRASQTDGGSAVLLGLTATETSGAMTNGEIDHDIIALLDTTGLSTDSSTASPSSPVLSGPPSSSGVAESDLRLLSLPDGDARQIPFVVVRNVIPVELHPRCHTALQTITQHEGGLAGRKTTRKSFHLALRTWSGDPKGAWAVRVFEALWRLRLWHGFGWDTQHVMGR